MSREAPCPWRATTDPDRPTISFLGRIDPLKDLLTLVTAFGIVHEQLPSARLKIYGVAPVGNEQYRDAVVARVAQLKLESAVTFCGRVERQADAYHAGHVVALSSISEGFPYTVVEAMACGRPVVATNVGGVSEAVADAGFVESRRVAGALV